jgi:putative RNA 2'-phosphotransferase
MMNDKQRTRLSKFLSKHLRHEPAGLGLSLEPGGWVPIEALLDGCRRAGVAIGRAELDEIVASSDKKRFAFDESRTKVRANQGHTTDVDLQLAPAEPPSLLYHGTGERSLPAILIEGLRKMARHHVHLSADIETATRVGARHGRPVVLVVDAAGMARTGRVFYVSANGVWLTDEVPRTFLRPAEGPPT